MYIDFTQLLSYSKKFQALSYGEFALDDMPDVEEQVEIDEDDIVERMIKENEAEYL